mgnify:CR=1 FL=1
MEANKVKALEAALSQIERQFGKGTVMRMGDQPRVVMPSISTGSLGLDIALGIGGLPKGRICEIYGPESSGKTTLTLQVIAEAQKAATGDFQKRSLIEARNLADSLVYQTEKVLREQGESVSDEEKAAVEGPLAFWTGFGAYYGRTAPHAMIILLSLEQINKLYASAFVGSV